MRKVSNISFEQHIKRRGLNESLEQYASRFGLSERAVRIVWRAQGLSALFAGMTLGDAMNKVAPDGLRIAPGIEVPSMIHEGEK